MRRAIFNFGILVLGAQLTLAQSAKTVDAFDHYITAAENRLTQARGNSQAFLKSDTLSAGQRNDVMARMRQGEVVIEKQGETPSEVAGGLIHDWVGTVLLPKVTVSQVLALVQDYDHLAHYYSPDVMKSRLISRKGDDFQVFMRLRKHKVITVVLDTEYAVHYSRLDAKHQYSLSRSTRVNEIEDPGSPNEKALPAGKDHGFMWRLNSYWGFEQVDDGVVVECEAISLTRDIPTGVAWMVGPFVNSIPRESLQFTLEAMRTALGEKTAATTP